MVITSRNNEKIKNAAALGDSKSRRERKRFMFEGVHLLEEFLRFGGVPAEIFLAENAYSKYKSLVSPFENIISLVSDNVYEKMSQEKSPQGIFVTADFLDNIKDEIPDNISRCLILDNVRDNGNVGGIIRTAAALGITNIILGEGCADVYSPKTLRASMGAIFALNIYRIDVTSQEVKALCGKGFRVFAADMEGDFEIGGDIIKSTDCFVIGNEGGGVSESVLNACSGRAFIPMSGKTESLNAASAAAILLWEMTKNG